MAETSESLLARLARGDAEGSSACSVVSAQAPTHQATRVETAGGVGHQEKLDHLLGRIAKLTNKPEGNVLVKAPAKRADPLGIHAPSRGAQDDHYGEAFFPVEPTSFQEASLTESEVEELSSSTCCRAATPAAAISPTRSSCRSCCLDELLRQMKYDQLVFHRGSAPMNDYQFQLTDLGRERARRLIEHCTYFGSAPVALADYIESVQGAVADDAAPDGGRPAAGVFDDLLINERMLGAAGPGDQLGPRHVPVRRRPATARRASPSA